MSLSYRPLHDCEPPDLPERGRIGERHQLVARWKCPECRSKWILAAEFIVGDRITWQRQTPSSRRWSKSAALTSLKEQQ